MNGFKNYIASQNHLFTIDFFFVGKNITKRSEIINAFFIILYMQGQPSKNLWGSLKKEIDSQLSIGSKLEYRVSYIYGRILSKIFYISMGRSTNLL